MDYAKYQLAKTGLALTINKQVVNLRYAKTEQKEEIIKTIISDLDLCSSVMEELQRENTLIINQNSNYFSELIKMQRDMEKIKEELAKKEETIKELIKGI